MEERDDVLSLLLQARHEDGSPMTDEELRDELITLLTRGTRDQRHRARVDVRAAAAHTAGARAPARGPRRRRLPRRGREGDPARAPGRDRRGPRRRSATSRSAAGRSRRARSWFRRSRSCSCAPTSIPSRARSGPSASSGTSSRRSYSWIPFGGGVRRCIGAAFAQLEIKTVLRTVLGRVRLSAPDPAPERQRSRHVTLVPAQDAVVVAEGRVAVADKREGSLLSTRA